MQIGYICHKRAVPGKLAEAYIEALKQYGNQQQSVDVEVK